MQFLVEFSLPGDNIQEVMYSLEDEPEMISVPQEYLESEIEISDRHATVKVSISQSFTLLWRGP